MRLVKEAMKAVIPRHYHFALRSAGFRLLHAGDKRYCPCCRSRVRGFKSFGHGEPRPDAQCPVCAALERDRAVARYFETHPALLAEIETVLHVAPERPIAHLLKARREVDYFSIDLEPGAAMDVMDLTGLCFADEAFDAVYCSNVLEHIPDDAAAMSEIHRVLRPGGWAMILVPLYGDETYEDFTVTDPQERTRLFGQPDHVRAYGVDIAERLSAAGFDVQVEQPASHLDEGEARHQGIDPREIVFVCRKPAQNRAALSPQNLPNVVPAGGVQPALRNRYAEAFEFNPHLEELRGRRRTEESRRRSAPRAS